MPGMRVAPCPLRKLVALDKLPGMQPARQAARRGDQSACSTSYSAQLVHSGCVACQMRYSGCAAAYIEPDCVLCMVDCLRVALPAGELIPDPGESGVGQLRGCAHQLTVTP